MGLLTWMSTLPMAMSLASVFTSKGFSNLENFNTGVKKELFLKFFKNHFTIFNPFYG